MMNYIEEYEKFISSELKIQILMNDCVGLTSKDEPITKNLMNYLYDNYIHLVLTTDGTKYNTSNELSKNRKNKIDINIPILSFTSKENTFLNTSKLKIYNKIEDYQVASDKVIYNKTFENEYFIPKTVYSLNDIKKLKFPIIAKPKNGSSAIGIEKFNTYNEAMKSKLKFDLWQEMIDIKTEFRAFIMNNNIIHITERVNNTNNDKSVGAKKPNEKIDLIYIDQKMKGFPFLNKIIKIKNILSKKVKLDLYTIDIIVDNKNNLWTPEINGAPGIGPSIFYFIYKNFIKLAYSKKISSKSENELTLIANLHRNMIETLYPQEYKKSLYPY